MTSQRKRKRAAQAAGLTTAELHLCELLEEILAALRWTQVLGWGNQYLLQEKLHVDAAERDRVMRAAAGTVARDGRLQDWTVRLQQVKHALLTIDAELRGAGRSGPADAGATAAPEAGHGG